MNINKSSKWWKIVLIIFGFFAILIASALLSEALSSFIKNPSLKILFEEIILRIPITLFSLHLFAKMVIRAKPEEFRVKKPRQNIFLWSAISLAFTLLVAFLILAFNQFEFFNQINSQSSQRFAYNISATLSMALGAAVIEEIIFRGAILSVLEKKLNLKVAIIIPSIFFGLIHLFMLNAFNFADLLLLFLGGSLAGIMFSIVTIKSKSIFPAIILHFAWNLFFSGKFIKIGTAAVDKINSSIYFHLNESSTFVNGGNFGPEVSGIAILGYSLLIAICYVTLDKSQKGLLCK